MCDASEAHWCCGAYAAHGGAPCGRLGALATRRGRCLFPNSADIYTSIAVRPLDRYVPRVTV